MTAEEIIPLPMAKTYLGLDDTSRDTEVERMVKSAIAYIEQKTNHVLVEKEITFFYDCADLRVYTYPVISTSPVEVTVENRPGYGIYTPDNSGDTELTVTVGYPALAAVPADLLEACYMVLKFMFYEQEGTGKMPQAVDDIVSAHARFLL